jgi:multiple sugar transport system substrate-binding protein
MSTEIEFSIMAPNAAEIMPLLEQFTAETNIRVRLRLLSWDTAWSDLIKVALYGDGPDVSEIGSTWIGDLVAMEAVRAFDSDYIHSLGGVSYFLPATWRNTRLVGDNTIWAIPWMVGARMMFYRRSLFERAQVEADKAFADAASFERALRQLHKARVGVPWTVPTGFTHTTFLNIATWVWGEGGDFVTPDGKRTLFAQPEAQRGVRSYFSLGKYLALRVRHLNGLEPDAQFLNDAETALTISGPWLFQAASAHLLEDLGAALPPGPSFVGGSYLVAWQHSDKAEAARELIRFLTRIPAQTEYTQVVGLVPVALAAHREEPFASGRFWQTAIRGLEIGRAFPVTRSWGLMEDRLANALAGLWRDVLNDPSGVDLDAAIVRRLEPLGKRLDLVLGQG